MAADHPDDDKHGGTAPVPAKVLLTRIQESVQLFMVGPAHRHQIIIFLLCLPGPRGCLAPDAVVAQMVQVQGAGLGQGELADRAGRLAAPGPGVAEPAHPPEPPLRGSQVCPVVGGAGAGQ
ncbi:hypothetical protein ACFFX0_25860 [Citricoccus parietis]|uniref:Uncharacterized protein n=1 Tax=Citricoccus parietis TaxID=592307 RepID=A0ABV5G664_9MICC